MIPKGPFQPRTFCDSVVLWFFEIALKPGVYNCQGCKSDGPEHWRGVSGTMPTDKAMCRARVSREEKR